MTSPKGPLSSPEKLLAAVRREILPALSEVLDAAEWQGITVRAEQIEIDLGHWPDDPVWSDVRYVLATKLRYALADYLPSTPAASVIRQVASDELADGISHADVPETEHNAHTARTLKHPNRAQRGAQNDPTTAQKPHAPIDRLGQSPWLDGQDATQTLSEQVLSRSLLAAFDGADPLSARISEARKSLVRSLLQIGMPENVAQERALALLHRLMPLLDPEPSASDPRLELSLFASERSERPQTRDSSMRPGALKGATDNRMTVDGSQISAEETEPLADPAQDASNGRSRPNASPQSASKEAETSPQPAQDLDNDISTPDTEAKTLPEDVETSLQTEQNAASGTSIPNAASGTSTPNAAKRTTTKDIEISKQSAQNGTQPDNLKVPTNTDSNRPTAGAPPTTDGADIDTNGHETSNATHVRRSEEHENDPSGKKPMPDMAVASPSKPVSDDARFLARRDAPPDANSAPYTSEMASGPSEASDKDYADDLREIAHSLGMQQGISHREFCIQILIQNPDHMFATAPELGRVKALVKLLGEDGPDGRPLLAKAPLAADKIRKLHAADPESFAKALAQLTITDAFEFARRLLPPSATLLVEHLRRLRDNAKSPRLAMHHATIALLNGDLLDFEDLAERSEAPFATPNPERGAQKVRAADENIAAENESLNARERAREPDTPLADVSGAPASDSLAETIMYLAGFQRSEIERILGVTATDTRQETKTPPRPDQPQIGPDTVGGDNPPKDRTETITRMEQSAPRRSDTDLFAKVSDLTKALAGSEKAPFTNSAELLLRAWPSAGTAEQTALRSAALRAELKKLTTPDEPTLSEYLAAIAEAIETDHEKRQSILRVLVARLSIPMSADEAHLRRQTRAAVETLLNDPIQQPPKAKAPARPAQQKPAEADSETLLVTEVAGLVLLNPFFTLLFDRLKIERAGKALQEGAYPAALGALHFLAGTSPGPAVDPFHRVILGLDSVVTLPVPQDPDSDAQALMDGLLRSVVERWGKLGATSPDGLRETFLRRTGTLRFEDTGAHLRVTPGPFDMLLDGLPWSIDRLVLPWMPLPCHVTWREDQDA